MTTDKTKFWKKRWDDGQIGWHIPDVNPWLKKYEDYFELDRPKSVFIPLCGKSKDLIWFYNKGFSVVGVEGVEEPVKDLFDELNGVIEWAVEKIDNKTVYKTKDDRLTVYVGDLFSMDQQCLGKFDAIWDRGSLGAIYIEDRERYATILKSLLADDFNYLLSVIQYDGKETASGPPRNIPSTMVQELYGDVCEIKILESESVPEERSTAWGIGPANQSVQLLTRKKS